VCPPRHRRIESFAVEEAPSARRTRRNPFVCCYEFLGGFRLGIAPTLGSAKDLKQAISVLSQDLVSVRAKASLQTQKGSFLVYIKTAGGQLVGCSIVHIDSVWKRVNIEMFAVDAQWRGNGFASMMVFLIQFKMDVFAKYDLFVCAATDALPFWSNPKYCFCFAQKDRLEEHEISDEKTGGTRHLIWYGSSVQARCALKQCFAAAIK